VSLAYLLTLVALLAPVGRLSDAHGRKLSYLYGFVVFTVASAACGLAPSLPVLVIARVVQAVGAALLQANSVALVTTSAPRGKMRRALGVQASAQALGLALGPTVGGFMVASIGWRWIFGVNVPVGVIAVVAGYYLLPRTRQRRSVGSFDAAGLVWLATATTALLLAVSAESGLRLGLPVEIALGVVTVVAAVAFVRREYRAASPLVDLRALRAPVLSYGLIGALFSYLVLFGPLVLVPVVLGGGSGTSAGLVLTALPAGFALAAVLAERTLPASWSDQRRAVVGAVMCVAATAALSVSPIRPLPLVVVLLVLGIGIGVFAPANNAMVIRRIPTMAAGTGGGLINMTRGLGTAFGIALVTLALHAGGTSGPRVATVALLGASVLIVLSAVAVKVAE
jgi:MFS family permease